MLFPSLSRRICLLLVSLSLAGCYWTPLNAALKFMMPSFIAANAGSAQDQAAQVSAIQAKVAEVGDGANLGHLWQEDSAYLSDADIAEMSRDYASIRDYVFGAALSKLNMSYLKICDEGYIDCRTFSEADFNAMVFNGGVYLRAKQFLQPEIASRLTLIASRNRNPIAEWWAPSLRQLARDPVAICRFLTDDAYANELLIAGYRTVPVWTSTAYNSNLVSYRTIHSFSPTLDCAPNFDPQDSAAPSLSAVGLSAVAENSITLTATSNEVGSGYWILMSRGALGETSVPDVFIPSRTSLAIGFSKVSGNATMGANAATDFNIAGLTPGTAYDLYFAAQDNSFNKTAVTKIQFATPALGALNFASRTDVQPSSLIESNTIAATWVGTSATISVSNGEYALSNDGGTTWSGWTSIAGTVTSSDQIKVRHISSASALTATQTTLTVGSSSGTFTSTTLDFDNTPDAFAFRSKTGILPATLQESNVVTVSGINTATAITVSGGEYATSLDGTNWGAWQTSGLVNNGERVKVRHTSSASLLGTTSTVLTIGSVSATFSTTTMGLVANADGTVTHQPTGLNWQRCAIGQTWSGGACTGTASFFGFAELQAQVDAANQASLHGHNDWRLPTLWELASLVDYSQYGPAINRTMFPNTPSEEFWSATPYANDPDFMRLVYFLSGQNYITCKPNVIGCTPRSALIRLVRGAPATAPASTPTAAFIDNGDGTVTHRRTQLTWKRCAEGQTWSGTTCEGFATVLTYSDAKATSASFAGHSDWRVPTMQELLSIAEESTYRPAINTTLFPNTPMAHFWSSDIIDADNSNLAWGVEFGWGSIFSELRNNGYRLRLVRGTQSFVPSDTTPDAFSFTAQSGVARSSLISSNTITVAGLDAPASIAISGGDYQIDNGGWTNSAGVVSNGQTVTVRHTSSASANTTVTTTLTIGGVSASFSTTTTTQIITPANGACGSAQGVASVLAPTANLCAAGVASSVQAGPPWQWTCAGSGGGTTASCSAPVQAAITGSGGAQAAVPGGVWSVDSSRTAGFIPVTGNAKSPTVAAPTNVSFPNGLLDFTLTGTAGTAATIVITYPNPIPANAVYWKYGPSPAGYDCTGAACALPHWYRMPAGQVVIAGNTITLTIVDGGVGDDDLTPNGTIVDAGGPGVPGAVGIPTLSQWALMLLALVLA
ncbi:DUF1566 domain-containing protein, partial [Rhodoferax sp.]|uniref:Lcl C-terminal domain-containing protein n=1 Tax=Rhodoferax sp. TaxID=50421 RepID=UPI002629AF42